MSGDRSTKAAKQLFGNRSRHGTEGNVEQDVVRLLETFEPGIVEKQYRNADIYLPNRRCFIETKAYPKAKNPDAPQGKERESPRAQLDRYVTTEIEDTLNAPGLEFDGPASTSPWTGILTDGKHWHVYSYSHERESKGVHEKSCNFINEAEMLVDFLWGIIGSEQIRQDLIPWQPGPAFGSMKMELDTLYDELPKKASTPTNTKFKLWIDMMRTSGMVPNDDQGKTKLFLNHTFLIIIIRLVSHSLRPSHSRGDHKIPLEEGFASWLLGWERGKKLIGKIWERVELYDWRMRQGDVLRELYHDYVDADDRKLFGEFYTPDWLAAWMVEQIVDDAWIKRALPAAINGDTHGIGILDPACGSGTFLYHAARRIATSDAAQNIDPVKLATAITRLINGMDIHPVAVEMARVNVERALPSQPMGGASAHQIYLGDSLQVQKAEMPLYTDAPDTIYIETSNGQMIPIPRSLATNEDFADQMRQLVNAAKDNQQVPSHITKHHDRKKLKACFDTLTQIIDKQGNSVWAWYAINAIGPRLLAERKIDRVIANPPWVKLADIQVRGRKRTMEQTGRTLGLQAGGKQSPHLDIASYFIIMARTLYMNDPKNNPAAWLVKRSALNAGQWGPFRHEHASTLTQSIDLYDLNPFNGGDATRCCILMEHRTAKGTRHPRLKAQRTIKKRFFVHESLNAVRNRFKLTNAEEPIPQEPSAYDTTTILQGATIVPHVLLAIESSVPTGHLGWTRITTSPSMHKPWKDLETQQGEIPTHWIRPILRSTSVLPYTLDTPLPDVIVPVNANNRLHSSPGNECPFWNELEEIYDRYKGIGRSTPKTLLKQIDFRKKLSNQPLKASSKLRMVIYPSSGDIMRAARARAGTAVVDSTLFWTLTRTEDEAAYLIAILNAPCLKRAFGQSKESGRHFQTHLWYKIPIPRYHAKNSLHVKLAKLCPKAEDIAQKKAKELRKIKPDISYLALSKAVRNAVIQSEIGRRIDDTVAILLPDQVTQLREDAELSASLKLI